MVSASRDTTEHEIRTANTPSDNALSRSGVALRSTLNPRRHYATPDVGGP